MKEEYKIQPISRNECLPFIIDIHYAKRVPSISFAYGLICKNELVGIITFGTPASSPLRNGIAGKENAKYILELNRLCLKYNKKNEASMLIGGSLKMLPKPKIIISFSDISQGHEGIVYKATNFMYCGLSAKRTDWAVKGKEHLHGQTIADEFRGVKNRAKAMRDKYGNDFYLKPRSRKHRYIKIIGSKSFRREKLKQIKYENNKTYTINDRC